MADIHHHARDTESSFQLQAVDSDSESVDACTGDGERDSSDDCLYSEDDNVRVN